MVRSVVDSYGVGWGERGEKLSMDGNNWVQKVEKMKVTGGTNRL